MVQADGHYAHGAGLADGIDFVVSARSPRAYVVSVHTPRLTSVLRLTGMLRPYRELGYNWLTGTMPTEVGLLTELSSL